MDYQLKLGIILKGTLLDVVGELYHKIKLGRKVHTFNSCKKLCYNFYFILRYAHGLITPFEIRKYFTEYMDNENISIPSSDTDISLFLRAVINQGLILTAEHSGNTINKLYKTFIKNYS